MNKHNFSHNQYIYYQIDRLIKEMRNSVDIKLTLLTEMMINLKVYNNSNHRYKTPHRIYKGVTKNGKH